MICKNCGNKVEDNTSICPFCGSEMLTTENLYETNYTINTSQPNNNQNKTEKIPNITLLKVLCVLCPLVGFILGAVYNEKNKEASKSFIQISLIAMVVYIIVGFINGFMLDSLF